MCGERRDREQHALQYDAASEVEHPAEPGGGERHPAQPPDHDRVGDAHSHLREIGGRQWCRQRHRCAQFAGDFAAGCCDAVSSPVGSNEGFHLALSVPHREPAVEPGERPAKKKGPDRLRRGPDLSRLRYSAHAHTPGPSGNAARESDRHQWSICATHTHLLRTSAVSRQPSRASDLKTGGVALSDSWDCPDTSRGPARIASHRRCASFEASLPRGTSG